MTKLTINLPNNLSTELAKQHISAEQLQNIVVQALEKWLTSERSESSQPIIAETTTLYQPSPSPAITKFWTNLDVINAETSQDSILSKSKREASWIDNLETNRPRSDLSLPYITPKFEEDTQDTPTISELLAELRQINAANPIEFEFGQRIDRPNPLLEMPDEFFM